MECPGKTFVATALRALRIQTLPIKSRNICIVSNADFIL
jgi:hypothetical protein